MQLIEIGQYQRNKITETTTPSLEIVVSVFIIHLRMYGPDSVLNTYENFLCSFSFTEDV